MNLHRKPVDVKVAIESVMKYKVAGEQETIPLEDADDRVLAEDVCASHPVPPFHKSPYDGFAMRSADTEQATRDAPVHLRVTETVGAGHRAGQPIRKGEAIRIMTGAEIPEGADCVAMFEICQTYKENDKDYLIIKRSLNSGQNIIEKGSETKEGSELVPAGTIVNPGVKALLATFGYAEVQVYKRPRVGVFATGTELLDVNEPLVPGKIRNSNAYMIISQIRRAGGEPVYYGKLEDDFEPCFQAVSKALEEVDFLITTGGVSVGDYDLMPDIYEKLNAQVLFNKVAMRPGSVTTVAEKGGKLLFGLSGNPSACYVGFELFTYPVIQAFNGKLHCYHNRIDAFLGTDFKKANPFTRFVRGFIEYKNGNIYVHPVGMDKSAVVTSLAHTNVLIVLRGGTKGYTKEDRVEAVLLDEPFGQHTF